MAHAMPPHIQHGPCSAPHQELVLDPTGVAWLGVTWELLEETIEDCCALGISLAPGCWLEAAEVAMPCRLNHGGMVSSCAW